MKFCASAVVGVLALVSSSLPRVFAQLEEQEHGDASLHSGKFVRGRFDRDESDPLDGAAYGDELDKVVAIILAEAEAHDIDLEALRNEPLDDNEDYSGEGVEVDGLEYEHLVDGRLEYAGDGYYYADPMDEFVDAILSSAREDGLDLEAFVNSGADGDGGGTSAIERLFGDKLSGTVQARLTGKKPRRTHKDPNMNKPNFCFLPVHPGSAGGTAWTAQVRFYYDAAAASARHACKPFSYSGSGGNKNRFSTAEECMEKCVLT